MNPIIDVNYDFGKNVKAIIESVQRFMHFDRLGRWKEGKLWKSQWIIRRIW